MVKYDLVAIAKWVNGGEDVRDFFNLPVESIPDEIKEEWRALVDDWDRLCMKLITVDTAIRYNYILTPPPPLTDMTDPAYEKQAKEYYAAHS